MTLQGVDDRRRRYPNLTDAQRITLVEVARYESGPMPPYGDQLLESVRDWTDLSRGKYYDYGIGPLAEEGLVEKHKDSRAVRIKLSDEGRRVLAAGHDLLNDVLETIDE